MAACSTFLHAWMIGRLLFCMCAIETIKMFVCVILRQADVFKGVGGMVVQWSSAAAPAIFAFNSI